MPLLKIDEFEPNYQESFDGNDIKGMDVYTEGGNEKIGSVSDVIVDDEGHFRYFVVDLGVWIFGKKVLMPVGRSRIDYKANRIYAVGMTKQQAEALPEFNERTGVSQDHEERVRGVYRTQEPSLYDLNEQDHQSIKLYQERLIASKKRTKTGEVTVGKHVETETQKVSVPIEKERVVIERTTPTDAGRAVAPGTVNFGSNEVTRMEVYEETADIHKEAFVREEVRINKVVDHETVEAQETIRREEIEIDTEGRTVVDDSNSGTSKSKSRKK